MCLIRKWNKKYMLARLLFHNGVMRSKDADGMANYIGTGQTTTKAGVCTGSSFLFRHVNPDKYFLLYGWVDMRAYILFNSF